jgi:hypothetical protein
MSDVSGIKVKNFKQTLKALQEMGVPTTEIKAANKEAGNTVLNAARPLVPVRTGRLLASLKVNSALNLVKVSAGNAKSVPYANPIHWGWYRRGIKPQPFFTTALKLSTAKIYESYFKQLDKLITETAQKANSTNG